MAFRGAGWNVIKVVWGREWDALLAADVDGVLVARMNETVDGDFQKYATESGAYIREHFFGPDPRLRKMVEHLSDEDLERLPRGGHDYRKLYAAYKMAVKHRGSPTVILTKTIKGWTLGTGVEARNATHQVKKLSAAELRTFRDRLHLDITDEDLGDLAPYQHPGTNSPEYEYLTSRRRVLNGALPRRQSVAVPLPPVPAAVFAELRAGTGPKLQASTTTAFARLVRKLLADPGIGPRVVPIVPDEARTFGLDALFSDVKIYAPFGQQYEPVDAGLLLSYREAKDGRILEEGISEAGSMASFTAAGTAYATWGEPLVPFFIFYSMFGFQRVGDLIWSFGDQRGRGFLLGATAGRTTLTGEGLQHCDGQSQLLASAVPELSDLRPGLRLRGRGHRRGRTRAHVRAGPRRLFLLPHALQRERVDAGDAARCGGRHRPRPLSVSRGRRWNAPRADPGERHAHGVRARRATDPHRTLRRARRRVERDELQAVARRRARLRTLEPAAPDRPAAGCVRHPATRRKVRPRRGGDRFLEARAGSDRAVRPGPFVSLGTDGYGLSGHAPRCAATSKSMRPTSSSRCYINWRAPVRSTCAWWTTRSATSNSIEKPRRRVSRRTSVVEGVQVAGAGHAPCGCTPRPGPKALSRRHRRRRPRDRPLRHRRQRYRQVCRVLRGTCRRRNLV